MHATGAAGQFRYYIHLAVIPGRRPADGTEPYLRPEVGFNPNWFHSASTTAPGASTRTWMPTPRFLAWRTSTWGSRRTFAERIRSVLECCRELSARYAGRQQTA